MTKSLATRLIFALLLVLLIVLLLMPRLVGGSIHSATIDSMVNMVPVQSEGMVTITQADFSNGWFTSDAIVIVTIPGLRNSNNEPLTINLDLDIQHGPLLFTSRGPSLGLAYADIVPTVIGLDINELDEFSEQVEVSAFDTDFYLLAGFDNSLRLGFGMTEVVLTEIANAGNRLSLDGVESFVTLHSDRSMEGAFTMGETRLNSTAESLAVLIDSVEYRFRQGDIDELVSDAQGRLSIPLLTSTAPLPFEFNGIVLDSTVRLSEPGSATIDYSNLLAIENMQWSQPVTAATWYLDIMQLNRQILEDYYLIMQQLQPGAAGSAAPNANEITRIAEEMSMRLIQESLQLSSRIEVDAYGGDVLMDLQVDWRGIPGVTTIASIDPGAAINAVDLQLVIDADETAVNQSPLRDLVNAYLRDGTLSSQNGRIRLQASLVDGDLVVNGRSFPLGQFLSL